MRVSSTIVAMLVTRLTHASVVPRDTAASGGCPAVWTQISQDLTALFVQSDGQCNDDSRAAVRAVFHDCGTWSSTQGTTGGCDGSLILSAEESARPENKGLQDISTKLKNLASQRGVGVADMIAFAGAHATLSCPLGPTVKTMIGRKDSSTTAPSGTLPASANLNADQILPLMADKGFSPADTAALIGAHTTARQEFVVPALAGAPQDRTPGIWDVDYYNDTIVKPQGVFVFNSDASLSQDSRSGPAFKSFIGQQAKWNQAFADTFARLALLGVPSNNLVDCTSALPAPRDSFPGANLPEPSDPSGVPAMSPPSAPQQPSRSRGPPQNRPSSFPSNFPSGNFQGRPTGPPSGRPTSAPSGRPGW